LFYILPRNDTFVNLKRQFAEKKSVLNKRLLFLNNIVPDSNKNSSKNYPKAKFLPLFRSYPCNTAMLGINRDKINKKI